MAEAMDVDGSEMRDGRLIKMEVDYTPMCDETIPVAIELGKKGHLQQGLERLYTLEKQTRLGHDMKSNGRILTTCVQMCFDAKDYDALNDTAMALAKKRSIIKSSVCKMVQLCCTFVEQMPDEKRRLALIESLRTLTAGKIYVECERARLTYKLVQAKEAKGELKEANELLLELQIETYGSMELKEKVELLLEQMRLTLTQEDFVRASIISKKISTRFFEKDGEDVQKLKLKYYESMVRVDVHDDKLLDVCRHYRAMAQTPLIRADAARLADIVKSAVIYVILSLHSNEQWDLLHRVQQDEDVKAIAKYRDLLAAFTSEQIISWPNQVVKTFERALRRGSSTCAATSIFADTTEGQKAWTLFQTRVGEHNIRILAKYYTDIKLSRMAKLLDWTVDKTEQFVCTLVTTGVIPAARIDRLEGVVRFKEPLKPVAVLDAWASDLRQLSDSLNKTAHLIGKEEMVHTHLLGHGKA